MLIITYNNTKPNERKFEYSIVGNNNVDNIVFDCSRINGGEGIDITELDAYVKIESKDKSYVDKIKVWLDANRRISFPLLAKTTAHKVFYVQLSFEDEDYKYQTQVVEITLKNSINADEEITNNYPTILKQLEDNDAEQEESIGDLEDRVDAIEPHLSVGELFDKHEGYEYGLKFKRTCQIAFTEAKSKGNHFVRMNGIDTKKSNQITNIEFDVGDEFGFQSFLEEFFNLTLTSIQDISLTDNELRTLFPKLMNYNVPLNEKNGNTSVRRHYIFYAETNAIENVLADAWHYNAQTPTTSGFHNLLRTLQHLQEHTSPKPAYATRGQFKFIANFVPKFTQISGKRVLYKWEGRMFNTYIDLVIHCSYVENDENPFKLLFIPKFKSFK